MLEYAEDILSIALGCSVVGRWPLVDSVSLPVYFLILTRDV